MAAWVYIVTNNPSGTLYIGVTSNIAKRAAEHRAGTIEGFSKRYNLKRLVHVEEHATMPLAIQRDKTLKHWSRAWKIALIENTNPDWRDLYSELI
ncbi:GIY-YIG nuclease family protein [Ferrovibrio sp.]|uniref:GIY-YIG nuclease family protein n=1 Tax=Ferrovibrio sp. TaxID=1917215 RepID=UPI001B3D1946|nr:GIY-YIG nuclease family protein [Ferrovibrio sp.]MBP7066613.1 GIY-YIG nuclease family protein [Ferrovibrio sp.]